MKWALVFWLLLLPAAALAAPYAVVGSGGQILNVIEWDGVAPYKPPAGASLVQVPAGQPASIGGTWNGSTFAPPPFAAPSTPPSLDASTLASVLIAKGLIQQTDINNAVTSNAGASVKSAVGSLP